MTNSCPICRSPHLKEYTMRSDYTYYECANCEALVLDPSIIGEIDQGRSLVDYTAGYWQNEDGASRDRSYGSSLARVAEVFLYARRPIKTFLDIGAGPGYLLDALQTYLPASIDKFIGIEKYPPPGQENRNPHLIIGDIKDLPMKIDAGCCIEVIEHLTPSMLSNLISELAMVAEEDAIFIFNSGQPSFVKNEDPHYLDPTGRGHLVSYSLKSIAHLAEPHGFRVHALPGKTWAFLLEKTESTESEAILDRIWTPASANAAVLRDPTMGSLFYILGIETARAYQ